MRLLITGLTVEAEVKQALSRGAHALGFDFREVGSNSLAENIREIIKKLPPFISKVGIFANAPRFEVEELITFLDLDTLIFTGQENAEYMKRWQGQKIIKEVSFKEGFIPLLDDSIDAILIDSVTADQSIDKINKPLIVNTHTKLEYEQVLKLAPWAVQVFCRTPLYEDIINGRVTT